MSLWKIAWRSIQQRALASSLTALSMALGVALVVAVLVAQGVIRDSFKRGAEGYHLVVGKKGSQLQLVLNTVYHLQDPIENVPYCFYKEFVNTPGHTGRIRALRASGDPLLPGRQLRGLSRRRHRAGLVRQAGIRRRQEIRVSSPAAATSSTSTSSKP